MSKNNNEMKFWGYVNHADYEGLKEFLKSNNSMEVINSKNIEGETALNIAAKDWDKEMAELLLEQGAIVDERAIKIAEESKLTALGRMAGYTGVNPVTKILRENNAKQIKNAQEKEAKKEEEKKELMKETKIAAAQAGAKINKAKKREEGKLAEQEAELARQEAERSIYASELKSSDFENRNPAVRDALKSAEAKLKSSDFKNPLSKPAVKSNLRSAEDKPRSPDLATTDLEHSQKKSVSEKTVGSKAVMEEKFDTPRLMITNFEHNQKFPTIKEDIAPEPQAPAKDTIMQEEIVTPSVTNRPQTPVQPEEIRAEINTVKPEVQTKADKIDQIERSMNVERGRASTEILKKRIGLLADSKRRKQQEIDALNNASADNSNVKKELTAVEKMRRGAEQIKTHNQQRELELVEVKNKILALKSEIEKKYKLMDIDIEKNIRAQLDANHAEFESKKAAAIALIMKDQQELDVNIPSKEEQKVSPAKPAAIKPTLIIEEARTTSPVSITEVVQTPVHSMERNRAKKEVETKSKEELQLQELGLRTAELALMGGEELVSNVIREQRGIEDRKAAFNKARQAAFGKTPKDVGKLAKNAVVNMPNVKVSDAAVSDAAGTESQNSLSVAVRRKAFERK